MRRSVRFARTGVLALTAMALAAMLLPSGSAASTGIGSISGRLSDFHTGLGIAGAQVTVRGTDFEVTATTGLGGNYSVSGLPTTSESKTSYSVRVRGVAGTESQFYLWENDGYIAASGQPRSGNYTMISLANGQKATYADLVGTKGGAVTGAVTFSGGPEAMGSYVVRAVSTAAGGASYSDWFDCGTAYCLAVPPGSYRVAVSLGDDAGSRGYSIASNGTVSVPLVTPFTSAAVTVATGATSQADAQLAYKPNISWFSGRILDPEGRPVPGAWLTAYYLRAERGWQPVWTTMVDTDADGIPDAYGNSAAAITRADGRFVLPLIAGSTYRFGVASELMLFNLYPELPNLAAQFHPHVGSITEAADVILAPGQQSGGDWTMPWGSTIRGTITDQLGRTLRTAVGSPAYVEVERLSAASGQWETAGDYISNSTTYAFRYLPEGTYRVHFVEEGWDMPSFYYGQTSTSSQVTTIVVSAVSQPTTITLGPAAYPGKLRSWMFASPPTKTVRRGATVKITATVFLGLPAAKNASVKIYRSYNSGRSWSYVKAVRTSVSKGTYTYSFRASNSVRYRFNYAGGALIAPSSATSSVKVK